MRSPPASKAAAGGLIGVNPIPENGFLLSCGLAGVLNDLSGPVTMLVTGLRDWNFSCGKFTYSEVQMSP